MNSYHVSRESLKCSQTLVKSRFFNDFIQKFSLYLISEVFWLPVGLTKLLGFMRLSRRFLAIVGAADPPPHGFPSRCPCRQRRHHYIQKTVIKEKREMAAYKLLLILQNTACHFVK